MKNDEFFEVRQDETSNIWYGKAYDISDIVFEELDKHLGRKVIPTRKLFTDEELDFVRAFNSRQG